MLPPSKNIKHTIVFLFGFFLLWDLYASFSSYLSSELLGDLAPIVLPVPSYSPILNDPLGFQVLMTGEGAAGPNRFWAHFITFIYFNNIPFLLQDLGVKPIDSIYLACGILKILTQIGIMLLLCKWVIGKKSIFSADAVVLSAFICTFFFTANTHHRAFDVKTSMTIIDNSIVYTIFYATSLLLLMLYLHPFLQRIWGFKENKFSIRQHILLFFLSFVISFNGPTNSPSILLICPLILLGLWMKNFRNITVKTALLHKVITAIKMIPRGLLIHFIWVILLNLYSFYLGTFNIENLTDAPSLVTRYALLLKGFYYDYICNIYHPSPLGILLVLILINTGLVVRFVTKEKQVRYLNILYFSIVFFVIYTLLLPLGGYRSYRPSIIRYDVIMPTTLGFLWLFFYSCYLLISHFKGIAQTVYALTLMSLLVFLSIIDRVPSEPTNQCEYSALEQFANSTEKVVALPPCRILSWRLLKAPNGGESYTTSKLLYRWQVIKDKDKRYYNVSPE